MQAALFDLGGVLIDWNPRYLFRRQFGGDEAAMENFLARIVPQSWNHEIDAGKPMAQAVAERSRLHPEFADLIALWQDEWEHMLGGAIAGSLEILAQLRQRGVRLLALTNWSAETFPIAQRRFGFLQWFEDIVVSGQVGLAKPDPRIFALAMERCRLDPAQTVFIDDSPPNVEAARKIGLRALHFRNADTLRGELRQAGYL